MRYLAFLVLALSSGTIVGQNHDHIVFDRKFDNPVTALQVSPDSTSLLVGDQSGKLYYLDGSDYEEMRVIENAGSEGILDIEITPEQDVTFVASGSVINLLDQKGESITRWSLHNTTIWSMDINQSGDRLLTAEMNRTFQLWDIFNGQVIKSLRAHEEPTLAVAFSADGKYFASGSNDKQVFLWNSESLEVTGKFHGLGDHIYDVEFSPDGNLLAACSKDKTIRIWQVDEQRLIHVLKGHQDMVMEIEFSPDGNYLLSASADFSIRLWDVKSGEKIYTFIENEAAVLDIAFLPDGMKFASACMDNHLKVREIHPEIFVLKYFGEEYEKEIGDDPVFLPRQRGEKRSEYAEREAAAKERKQEIIDKYYARYLEMRISEKPEEL